MPSKTHPHITTSISLPKKYLTTITLLPYNTPILPLRVHDRASSQAKPRVNIPLAPREGAFASHLESRAKCRPFGVSRVRGRGGPLRHLLLRSRRSFVRGVRSFASSVRRSRQVSAAFVPFVSCSQFPIPRVRRSRPSVIGTPHPSMRPPSVSTSVRPDRPARARP